MQVQAAGDESRCNVLAELPHQMGNCPLVWPVIPAHHCCRAGRSHMVPYLEVLQPLAERGHNVTVVTDKDESAWLAPNYPRFELRFVPDSVNQRMHEIRHGDSSMAKEMFDPNKRGKQSDLSGHTCRRAWCRRYACRKYACTTYACAT